MTKTFPDYEKATNAAYSELRNYNGGYPRVNIFALLKNYSRVQLHTFSESAAILGVTLDEFIKDYSESYMGFTIYDFSKKRWLVYYNDAKCITTIRFTIAHELGHIVLGHTKDNLHSDKEANCFARNILCPAPIIEDLNLNTCEDYCSCFNVSEPMAAAAKGNHSSDMYYISRENYDAISFNFASYLFGYSC